MTSRDATPMNDPFAWGAPCSEGLRVGLHLDGAGAPGQSIAPATPLRWRWALRNEGTKVRAVTVRHDADQSFRVRLRVTRAGHDEPLWDFAPPPSRRPSALRGEEVLVLPTAPVELAGGEAGIDATWGPGAYRLQVIFGGPAFTFDCRSGAIEIAVR
jgi:hypothetical protein